MLFLYSHIIVWIIEIRGGRELFHHRRHNGNIQRICTMEKHMQANEVVKIPKFLIYCWNSLGIACVKLQSGACYNWKLQSFAQIHSSIQSLETFFRKRQKGRMSQWGCSRTAGCLSSKMLVCHNCRVAEPTILQCCRGAGDKEARRKKGRDAWRQCGSIGVLQCKGSCLEHNIGSLKFCLFFHPALSP